jgi:uncharacterized protein (DUF1501 family)
MSLTRRDFLGRTAAAGAIIASTNSVPNLLMRAAAAAPTVPNDNVLVVVQLTGGNDGLNTVIPYADDVYNAKRYALRIGEDQVLRLNDYLGFHPSLGGLRKIYENERLAVVQGIGYPEPNRSHFESMDIWHTAMQTGGARQIGWLGRWLDANCGSPDVAADVPGVHLGSEVQPLALTGLKVHVPSIGSIEDFRLRGVEDAECLDAIEQAIAASRGERSDLLAFLQDASQSALAASRRLQDAVGKDATGVEYPTTGLAQRLKSVAQLIDAGLATRIYYVALDGFDTHSQQADAHAALLTELSDAVSALLQDLSDRDQAERVLVMCFSEFGRRLEENGSQGTDHGAAAPMFIAGGRVQGGIVGEHPSLTDLIDGDPKFHTDFRRVYATVLEDWLGSASEPLLGGPFEKLPLVAPS